MKQSEILTKLIEHFGSEAEVARRLNVSRQAVNKWKEGKYKIAPKSVLKISDILDIPVTEIRPDIYPAQLVKNSVID